MAKFEINKSKSGFSFNFLADNGKIIITSEGYSTKLGAQIGIASVKKNAKREEYYATLKSKDAQHYFLLKSRNGRVIGKSETYKSPAAMNGAIEVLKKLAPKAIATDTW